MTSLLLYICLTFSSANELNYAKGFFLILFNITLTPIIMFCIVLFLLHILQFNKPVNTIQFSSLYEYYCWYMYNSIARSFKIYTYLDSIFGVCFSEQET